MRLVFSATTVSLALLATAGVSEAHFNLLQPPPADSATDGGKGAPPCGPTTASGVVTPAQGGHPLMVSLSETVMHPGHYRIALSVNSRSELPADPVAVVQNGQSVSAPVENPAVFPVLADGVFTHTTGTAPISFMTSVMLPNITCAKCTLQVIEFMAQHGPNPGGGYYYHHCADLKITADPSLPTADGGVIDGGTDGGATGTGGAAGASGSGGRSGAGGSTTAGSGGTTATGSGGDTSTGSGGDTSTGSGGTTTTGSGGTTTAGSGGAMAIGSGGASVSGSGGHTAAGSGGAIGAGSGGSTVAPPGANSSGGCACAIDGGHAGSLGGALLTLAGSAAFIGVGVRRRRRRR